MSSSPVSPRRPVVAILNANEDLVEVLRIALEMQGFHTAGGHVTDIKRGRLGLDAFREQHRPDVLVYDVAPPYEDNWNFLQELRTSGRLEGLPVVVTTTNKVALDALVGETGAQEIIGKPFDIQALVRSVCAALERARIPLPEACAPGP